MANKVNLDALLKQDDFEILDGSKVENNNPSIMLASLREELGFASAKKASIPTFYKRLEPEQVYALVKTFADRTFADRDLNPFDRCMELSISPSI